MKQRKLPYELSGHKYKYVSNLDIIETDEQYIKNLEQQVEQNQDCWNWLCHDHHTRIIPMIARLRRENRELKVELAMIKKFLEKAKKITNQNFE